MADTKFVHIVNFWLKHDLSEADIKKFEASVSSLAAIESLVYFNLGKPAATDRQVIDRSYSYSLLTVFKDASGHDIYQTHPVHLQFIADCKGLWDRILIYDSESI